ncbi:MAG: DUF169 domain-containing protein [candidate division WOR-3 bacterium]|uniref:DUF169 domain-containing protein n=1 Tax=candidate division WOR-3 bacterium TaxID=2052148 RepID=A0A7C4VZI3_UNCW3
MEEFKEILSLKLLPVGVKFLQKEESTKGEFLAKKLTFCQFVHGASQERCLFKITKENLGCASAQFVFGFREYNEKDIDHHLRQFTFSKESAKKLIEIKPKLPINQFTGLLVGDINSFTPDKPDVVILIIDSAQALPLIEAYTTAYEKDITFCNGVSSAVCSYGVVFAYQTKKPNLTIPCVGAKRYGLFQDHQLVFSLPWEVAQEIKNQLIRFAKSNKLHLPIKQAYYSPVKENEK